MVLLLVVVDVTSFVVATAADAVAFANQSKEYTPAFERNDDDEDDDEEEELVGSPSLVADVDGSGVD